jgi:uncharacterized membrane protein
MPLAVLMVGAVLDGVTTYSNVRDYSADVEVHPVQRVVFQVLGPAVGVPVAKALQVACVLFVAALWRRWCPWVLVLSGLLYALAAASNHFLWF